jgi:hypothetical protein
MTWDLLYPTSLVYDLWLLLSGPRLSTCKASHLHGYSTRDECISAPTASYACFMEPAFASPFHQLCFYIRFSLVLACLESLGALHITSDPSYWRLDRMQERGGHIARGLGQKVSLDASVRLVWVGVVRGSKFNEYSVHIIVFVYGLPG